MATVNFGEPSWQRAWTDSERFRKESVLWFWICEVFGIGATAATGGVLGATWTPTASTGIEQAMYPAIGGVVGAVVGGLLIFGIIYVLNFVRAPYRQRNEARQEVARLRERLDDREALPTLKRQLAALLDEGRNIERQCSNERSPLPIAPAENWRRRTRALLEEQVAKYIADIWDEPGFAPLSDSSVQGGPSLAQYRELWMPIAARVRRLDNILKGFER